MPVKTLSTKINDAIFREYDIRGLVGDDLDEARVERIGHAIGVWLSRQGARSCVLGRDVRPSSDAYGAACERGLLAAGLKVVRIGTVPTPLMYFSVRHLECDAGVSVTASHNPAPYNGFKVRLGSRPVFGAALQEIRALAHSDLDTATGGEAVDRPDVVDEYVRFVVERLRPARGLRVVADAGNGVAGPIAERVLSELGYDLIPQYCEPDGRFPNHLPDPSVDRYMADLCRRVPQEGADLGVAFDGDGDRVGAVDERGAIVRADMLLLLFARDVLERRGGAPVVYDIKCSDLVGEEVRRHGGTPILWKTGYPHVQTKVAETGALVAGELSGHMYFADDYFGFDDGVYAACRLAELVARRGQPLSELLADVPERVSTPEIRVETTDERKWTIIEEVAAELRSEGRPTVDVDGVRVEFEGGWALVRASNTQGVLVLRFEAETPARLESIQESIRSKLRRYPELRLEF